MDPSSSGLRPDFYRGDASEGRDGTVFQGSRIVITLLPYYRLRSLHHGVAASPIIWYEPDHSALCEHDPLPPARAVMLSLRIVNWIKWALAGNLLAANTIHSLALQARYLARRSEYHLLGNHLLANAKALVFAGLFFAGEEADAWLAQGLQILAAELPEQILADGGHFERSPMYHCLVLEDLLDLCNLCCCYTAGEEALSKLSKLSKRLDCHCAKIVRNWEDWGNYGNYGKCGKCAAGPAEAAPIRACRPPGIIWQH